MTSRRESLQHEILLDLASGAHLKIRYFSDREMRWIFAYNYSRPRHPDEAPVINDVHLVTNYTDGLLEGQLILSMHVVLPARLGQKFFLGIDISPGAKTYLTFSYERTDDAYRLTEVCKGATRMPLGAEEPAIIRPVMFPFPIPDRVPLESGRLRIPFRTNAGHISYFDLPEKTLRHAL